MTDDAIIVLTEMLIKEHSQKKEKYVVTQQQLIQLCIKVIKEMQRIYES